MKFSFALLAGACLCAFGVNRSVGDNVSAVATFNNIGVDVQFTTAPPAGTTVDMAIKVAGSPAPYAPIHPLSPIAAGRYDGSAFWLDPDTTYSLRLSSAAFASDQYLTVKTRSDAFPSATGAVYHVAVGGDDSNNGLTSASAFATVGHALAVAQAGDQVQLHDGRYYEGDLSAPRSGSATAPIVITSAPGEHAVLDGTNPNFAPTWTLVDAANKVYATPASAQPRNAYVDGGQMFRYGNLNDLKSNVWNTPGGYYADGSNLYVRFPNGDAPAAHTVTVPRYTTGLTIENQNYIQVKNLEIAYYGLNDFHRGIYIDGGDYNLIDNVYFHQNGIGVALKRAADFNTIQNSRFSEAPSGSWSFESVKTAADDYEAGAVYVYGSTSANSGNVIRNNLMESMFDGSSLYSFNAAGPTTNMDFYGNVVRHTVDDGLQTDGAGVNVRIYRNSFSDFLSGISLAPAGPGPTYVMRNLLTDWAQSASGDYEGYPFKLNVVSDIDTNWVYIYQNTAFTDEPGQDAFLIKTYSDWFNVLLRNNIFAGTRYALESWALALYNDRINMNWDDLYTTDPTRFISWAGSKYWTLAAFYAATGQELNGLSLPPGFIDPATGNFYLLPTSGMIDRGLIIPGVNDGYYGLGPDLGAFEFEPPGVVPEPAPFGLALLAFAPLILRRRTA